MARFAKPAPEGIVPAVKFADKAEKVAVETSEKEEKPATATPRKPVPSAKKKVKNAT